MESPWLWDTLEQRSSQAMSELSTRALVQLAYSFAIRGAQQIQRQHRSARRRSTNPIGSQVERSRMEARGRRLLLGDEGGTNSVPSWSPSSAWLIALLRVSGDRMAAAGSRSLLATGGRRALRTVGGGAPPAAGAPPASAAPLSAGQRWKRKARILAPGGGVFWRLPSGTAPSRPIATEAAFGGQSLANLVYAVYLLLATAPTRGGAPGKGAAPSSPPPLPSPMADLVPGWFHTWCQASLPFLGSMSRAELHQAAVALLYLTALEPRASDAVQIAAEPRGPGQHPSRWPLPRPWLRAYCHATGPLLAGMNPHQLEVATKLRELGEERRDPEQDG